MNTYDNLVYRQLLQVYIVVKFIYTVNIIYLFRNGNVPIRKGVCAQHSRLDVLVLMHVQVLLEAHLHVRVRISSDTTVMCMYCTAGSSPEGAFLLESL